MSTALALVLAATARRPRYATGGFIGGSGRGVPVPLTEPVILAQTGRDYTALLAALNTHTKETR